MKEIDDNKESQEEVPSRKRRLGLIALIATTNFLLAAVVAITLLAWWKPGPEKEPDPPPVHPMDVARTIAGGDSVLLAGRTKDAVVVYESALRASDATDDTRQSIAFRIGLCAELENQLDQAFRYYQGANRGDFGEASLASEINSARILFRQGHLQNAHGRLAKLAAIESLPVSKQTRLGDRVRYALALVVAAEALQHLPTSPAAIEHLFPHRIEHSISEILAMAPVEGSQAPSQGPGGNGLRTGLKISSLGRNPYETLVSCHLADSTSKSLLNELARLSGWKIVISPEADEVMSVKTITIQINDKTAAEVLSLSLSPQQLFWAFDEDTLIVDRLENFNKDLVLTLRIRRAASLLNDALALAPNDKLAPQALLALGNLAAADNRTERAETYYRSLLQRHSRHPTAAAAKFNLAKHNYQQKRFEVAFQQFQEVSDVGARGDVVALAFLYLGRMQLEMGKSGQAKRNLSRSAALTTDADIVANAISSLAASYLMRPEDAAFEAANSVMLEHRDILRAPSWFNLTAFLSSLSRYRAALTKLEKKRRAQELLAASVKVNPQSFFGDFGFFLVGDAFSELNVTSQALRVYRDGLDRTRGRPTYNRLLHRVALAHRKNGEPHHAMEALEELIALQDSPWSDRASVELAEILMERLEYERCVTHCSGVIQQSQSQESQRQLLSLLGRAYEELGDHEQAALCFAGFLPVSMADQETQEVKR